MAFINVGIPIGQFRYAFLVFWASFPMYILGVKIGINYLSIGFGGSLWYNKRVVNSNI